MKRSSIKNEINSALEFYMHEYEVSREGAKMPTAEMYIYLYLNGGLDTNDLVEILDVLKGDTVLN